MKVSELIEELSKYPPDMDCRILIMGEHAPDAFAIKRLSPHIPIDDVMAFYPDYDDCI